MKMNETIETIINQNFINTKKCLSKALDKRDFAFRHRLSDQKWRQNLNNNFSALKTIIKQSRPAMDRGLASKKSKNKKSSQRITRIETLKTTIDLIKTNESVIENIINERQQQLADKKPKNESSSAATLAVNGLQRIKDIFNQFEIRYELEAKTNEVLLKPFNSSPIEANCPLVEDKCLDSLSFNLKPDLKLNEKPEVTTEGIRSEVESNESIDDNIDDNLVDSCLHLLEPKTEFDFDSNEEINEKYLQFLDLSSDLSADYLHSSETSDLRSEFSDLLALDGNECYDLDPNQYLTTNLAEHLARNIPITPFDSFLYL